MRKANRLLELHSKKQLRIFATMDMRIAKGLFTGNLIRVNLPKQGILNDEYRVMKITYKSNGLVGVELGTSDITLAQMIAHSLVTKDSTTGSILPQTKIGDSEPMEIVW